MTFENYINNNNKILLSKYTDYLIGLHIANFVIEAKWPLLIGKDLFEGDFTEKTIHGPNATFKFIAKAHQDKQHNLISKSVYVVRKGLDNKNSHNNTIVIGRSSQCDITITDYSISKQHAAILRQPNGYSIIDRGSTNGVKVKEHKVGTDKPYPIKIGQIIHFGRFSFHFVHPIYFYCMVYVSAFSMLPPLEDFLRIAKETPAHILIKIARNIGYKPQNPSKDELLEHMKAELTPFQMIKCLSQLPLLL